MSKIDVEMKGGRETDLEGLRVMCIPWPYRVHKFWNIDLHASFTVVSKKSVHPRKSTNPLLWLNFLYRIKVYMTSTHPGASFAWLMERTCGVKAEKQSLKHSAYLR